MTSVEYYKFPAGARWDYARVNPDEFTAEYFDPLARTWVPMDAYYDEVYHNGNGILLTEAEVREAVDILQSACMSRSAGGRGT